MKTIKDNSVWIAILVAYILLFYVLIKTTKFINEARYNIEVCIQCIKHLNDKLGGGITFGR